MTSKNNKMLLTIILIAIVSISAFSLEYFYFRNLDSRLVDLNQVTQVQGKTQNQIDPLRDISKYLTLEYAKTDQERQKGLMDRTSLCENCAMFFIFESERELSFWMKNTFIPLDIIFITENGTILNIEKADPFLNSQNDAQYPRYISKGKAKYVLEVNQNWSQKNNLRAGDKIDLSKLEI